METADWFDVWGEVEAFLASVPDESEGVVDAAMEQALAELAELQARDEAESEGLGWDVPLEVEFPELWAEEPAWLDRI